MALHFPADDFAEQAAFMSFSRHGLVAGSSVLRSILL
jgi:hypothetical protein